MQTRNTTKPCAECLSLWNRYIRSSVESAELDLQALRAFLRRDYHATLQHRRAGAPLATKPEWRA